MNALSTKINSSLSSFFLSLFPLVLFSEHAQLRHPSSVWHKGKPKRPLSEEPSNLKRNTPLFLFTRPVIALVVAIKLEKQGLATLNNRDDRYQISKEEREEESPRAYNQQLLRLECKYHLVINLETVLSKGQCTDCSNCSSLDQ